MSSGFPAGPTSRSVVAESARLRAVELARSEGAILADSLALASTALAAIRFRSRHPAMECAEVRALGLERLPNSDYLGLVVQRLCTELGRSHSRQTWLAAVEEQAAEIEAMLQLAVMMTSVIDVAGELDLPLSQVTAVQTGARAGLSAIARMREHLHTVETGVVRVPRPEPVVRVAGALPSWSAQWLVQLAGRLLPGSVRDRYLEEFTSELCELADADLGAGAQFAHAFRLAVRAWSLRRSLPSAATLRPADGWRRRRVPPRADGAGRHAATHTSNGLRHGVQRWQRRREARTILRYQARQKARNQTAEDRVKGEWPKRHRNS
jgi:hypothetical protein